MFDSSQRTPEMDVEVTLGDFHATHEAAAQARDTLKGGVAGLSTDALNVALGKLKAAQRLTDAETGPDCMFATSYLDVISIVEAELASR